MTDNPTIQLLTSLHEYITHCTQDRITGQLVIKIPFNQGGIGQVKVERQENLPKAKKKFDNRGFIVINGE